MTNKMNEYLRVMGSAIQLNEGVDDRVAIKKATKHVQMAIKELEKGGPELNVYIRLLMGVLGTDGNRTGMSGRLTSLSSQ